MPMYVGKTTLVNYILKEQTKWKICVVENEFGEVQIDGDLVEENLNAREDIITMDNGCVCCSIRGDLVRTFSMLTGILYLYIYTTTHQYNTNCAYTYTPTQN